MTLNPASQYANDRNFRARQQLWQHQEPYFDLTGWVVELAGLSPGVLRPGLRVLDAGCGNGAYLRAVRALQSGQDTGNEPGQDRQPGQGSQPAQDREPGRDGSGGAVRVVGMDLSAGMLASISHSALVNADVAALPLCDGAVDVALAVHMLYHVPDRERAVQELRRVVAAGGVCVAVTNGERHLRALWDLVEAAARTATAGWQVHSPPDEAFSAENGAAQLRAAFESVTMVTPPLAAPVVIRDASLTADYVASVGDHYQDQVARPWPEIVEDVRQAVQKVIDADGAFTIHGHTVAFVCR